MDLVKGELEEARRAFRGARIQRVGPALILSLSALFLLPARPAAPAVDPSGIPLARVMDLAEVITAERERQVKAVLEDLERGGLVQGAVLTLPSLEGESIESFSLRAARHWGLGGPVRDNGLLMAVVPGERQYRLEVGRGLSAALPDDAAHALARGSLVPAFRQDDYGTGVLRLLRALGGAPAAAAIGPPATTTPSPEAAAASTAEGLPGNGDPPPPVAVLDRLRTPP